MSVNPIPDGCNSINAYIIVPNALEAIAFYKKAFGAEAGLRLPGPDGQSTIHAEMRIGNSTLMLTDENPAFDAKSAGTLGGSPVSLHLYVADVDQMIQQAVDAGCQVVAPTQDMWWGDRFGKLRDPYGLHWSIATHQEDVPPEEMQKRTEEWLASMNQV